MLQRSIFYFIPKDADPSSRVKMQQKLFFWIFTTIYHILSGFGLFILFLLNPVDGQLGRFVLRMFYMK